MNHYSFFITLDYSYMLILINPTQIIFTNVFTAIVVSITAIAITMRGY